MPGRSNLPARLALAALLGALAGAQAAPAAAAGPPQIEAAWVTEVTATSALLHTQINPAGATTTYHFSYIAQAAYEANLQAGREGFAGAARAPGGADQGIGAGSSAETAFQPLAGLGPETAYRYRVIAQNTAGPAQGPEQTLATRGLGGPLVLLDDRGWEMVSPVEKNGGAVAAPESLFGGGVLQAAAAGGAVTYSSTSSFGEGAQGAPQASQYISRRSSGGWSAQNITAPTVSGAYGAEPDGVPYRLFSPDLSSGLLLNGEHCQGSGCPLDNPPLPGTQAPAGYQGYYLRDDEDGGLQALLSEANSGELSLGAAQFSLAFAGAAPDLRHVVLSSCAKLTPEATEVPGAEGCEAPETNLYEWGEGQLRLLNILPHAAQGTPGAQLAAQSLAVSTDGSRAYFTDAGKLYLREGGETKLLAAAASFQTASADGSVAFFTEGAPEHETLYRYRAATETSEPLAGEVKGVLGASEDGSYLYYATAAGLFLWHEGTTTPVSATPGAAAESDWPPATGTARVSPDGSRLAFLSKASKALSGYDNTDQSSAQPDSEVYLYSVAAGGGAGTLLCASCNPTGERPLGPSSIPGAIANGQGEGATQSYKPRDLAAGGRRLFFDSPDPLVSQDTNKAQDVYEWEAGAAGSCQRPGGCVGLISSGNSAGGAGFVDASADGADAFFLTEGSLVPSDPGSVDLYDAREGGGFPVTAPPIACEGDACQPLPSPPEDPAPGTLVPSSGNPPVHFPKAHRKKPHRKKRDRHRKSGRRR